MSPRQIIDIDFFSSKNTYRVV